MDAAACAPPAGPQLPQPNIEGLLHEIIKRQQAGPQQAGTAPPTDEDGALLQGEALVVWAVE